MRRTLRMTRVGATCRIATWQLGIRHSASLFTRGVAAMISSPGYRTGRQDLVKPGFPLWPWFTSQQRPRTPLPIRV